MSDVMSARMVLPEQMVLAHKQDVKRLVEQLWVPVMMMVDGEPTVAICATEMNEAGAWVVRPMFVAVTKDMAFGRVFEEEAAF